MRPGHFAGKEKNEDKEWAKLRSVTLTETHERQNNDTLKQKDRGNCAITQSEPSVEGMLPRQLLSPSTSQAEHHNNEEYVSVKGIT